MSTMVFGDPAEVLAGIPSGLRDPLVEEFNKIVRNFREGRWEPAALNGGKFAEVVYTILRGHVDGVFPSAPSKPPNMVDACRALERATAFPRSVRIQVPRMLVALYEIRNNRNVGHVGADVDPNGMDASVVVAKAKWILAELIRVFHATTPQAASQAVGLLTERTIPLLWNVGGKVRVLDEKLTAHDKVLAVLYGLSGAVRVSYLAESIEYGNLSRFRTSILKGAHRAGLVNFDRNADTVELSPLGARYVETNIPLEL